MPAERKARMPNDVSHPYSKPDSEVKPEVRYSEVSWTRSQMHSHALMYGLEPKSHRLARKISLSGL
jgi:hypothetical protein